MMPMLLLAALSAYCGLPDDVTASAQLYEVTSGNRLVFYRFAACDQAACREHAYVVPGDRVVVFARAGTRSCVAFARTRETTGWVDSDRLQRDEAASHPPLSAWKGDWHDGDDHIHFDPAAEGRLRIDADAYYPSKHPGPNAPANWPHFGEMAGLATVSGDRADYRDGQGEYDCRATFRLLGEYLLVNDDEHCGGQNVRFRGVYRRRQPRS